MRKILLLVVVVLALASCKVREKRAAKNSSSVSVLQKLDKPTVNSVVGKYNFIDSTKAKVFIKTNITLHGEQMSLEKLNESFKVQWTLQTNFGIREKLHSGKIEFTPNYALLKDGNCLITFEIPRVKEQESAVLLVEFIHSASATRFAYDMQIDFSAVRTNTRFELYNSLQDSIPSFVPYIKTGQPFTIKAILPTTEKFYLVQYDNQSKAALSPMSASQRDPASEFQWKETLEVADRQLLKFNKPGMYVLTQNPEEIKDGFGFLVVDNRFPRSTQPADLLEPLVYMSTSKEIESANSFSADKDKLDMYFLNLAKGDTVLAKKIIKTYFKRVEDANEIFTSYKEGWKTDKGMVYVIMGPPTRVQRNRSREVWMYAQNRNTSEIIYTFLKKPNLYSDQNYDLVRYPEYSAFWYPYVEAWRTGKQTE